MKTKLRLPRRSNCNPFSQNSRIEPLKTRPAQNHRKNTRNEVCLVLATLEVLKQVGGRSYLLYHNRCGSILRALSVRKSFYLPNDSNWGRWNFDLFLPENQFNFLNISRWTFDRRNFFLGILLYWFFASLSIVCSVTILGVRWSGERTICQKTLKDQVFFRNFLADWSTNLEHQANPHMIHMIQNKRYVTHMTMIQKKHHLCLRSGVDFGNDTTLQRRVQQLCTISVYKGVRFSIDWSFSV